MTTSSPLTPVSFRKNREHMPRLSEKRIPGRHSDRFWTEEEKKIIRDVYPSGGLIAVLARLPNRSKSGVYLQAAKLGLSRGGGQMRRIRHEPPPNFEETLRERWAEATGRGSVAALAEELGVPRFWLSQQACKLGLTVAHKKEPPWSAAEDELMKKVPLHDPERCAEIFQGHGFLRSPTAIAVRAKRLNLSRRRKSDMFTATQAAKILGVDNKTLSDWCIKGELRATRRDDRRLPQQGGAAWQISPTDLRDFIVAEIARLDIRKVERVAFVDLLTAVSARAEAALELVEELARDTGPDSIESVRRRAKALCQPIMNNNE